MFGAFCFTRTYIASKVEFIVINVLFKTGVEYANAVMLSFFFIFGLVSNALVILGKCNQQ